MKNPGAWRFNKNGETVDSGEVNNAAGGFELARSYWTGSYGDVNGNTGMGVSRPYYDIRVLGPVTLTHGAP